VSGLPLQRTTMPVWHQILMMIEVIMHAAMTH
jgi:hypothetical protein